MTLQVGYAQSIITPSLERPVFLAGFGRNRQAVSVHDDLSARALALSTEETTLVLVGLDLLGLGRASCMEIAAQLRAEHAQAKLLIACTHTHHGPDTIGLWGPDEATSGVDHAYLRWVKAEILNVAVKALSNIEPAGAKTTSVDVPDVAQNARDPGIVDHELTCIQFVTDDEEQTLATWLIYPCHPEVLWDDNAHITSDYIDAMRRTVESASDGPCLAMVGALGGMMTPDMPGHTFEDAKQMGITLGEAALTALADAGEPYSADLTWRQSDFDLPLGNPLFVDAQQTGLLAELLPEAGFVQTETSLMKIGDAWLVGVPGELLPKLGLRYKQMMIEAGAKVPAIIGLANDELGYILPDEDFVAPTDWQEPGDSYEESMSICADAGSRLTEAIEALM